MVIISASGMAETGRILHHLKNNVENPRNTVLIVGWQAPDTLGRRLVEGAKELRIFGQLFEVRAEVQTINGLSAHAGQSLLTEYGMAVRDQARKVFLVHGEQGPAGTLQKRLQKGGLEHVYYPFMRQIMELD